MDNYEWNHGMDSRFGLFSIDPNDKNKTRVPRSAVNAFREISMAREWPE
jgi:beta-glucosidase/6-phospho-beta-glucosidase/beta-galactosidase